MKNNVLIVAILLILTNVQASDHQIIGGVEFGQSKSEWDGFTGDRDNSIGARLGVETKESRIYVSYNNIDTDTDIDSKSINFEGHTLALNLEAIAKPYLKILRVFVGGHMGAIHSELDTPWYTSDETNFIYGAQTGVLIDIMDNSNLEIGYKYSWTTADEDTSNPENIQTCYTAINLKF